MASHCRSDFHIIVDDLLDGNISYRVSHDLYGEQPLCFEPNKEYNLITMDLWNAFKRFANVRDDKGFGNFTKKIKKFVDIEQTSEDRTNGTQIRMIVRKAKKAKK